MRTLRRCRPGENPTCENSTARTGVAKNNAHGIYSKQLGKVDEKIRKVDELGDEEREHRPLMRRSGWGVVVVNGSDSETGHIAHM